VTGTQATRRRSMNVAFMGPAAVDGLSTTADHDERKGWEVAGLYADNDVSAYSGRPRPQWQRLGSVRYRGPTDPGVPGPRC